MNTPTLRTTTNVEVLLNTLQHERHARAALLAAFADELQEVMSDRAPESTRTLLARAEGGQMGESEFRELLTELRALLPQAA